MTHSHGHSHDGAASGSMYELLELDGEVLHDYWSEALDWVAAATGGTAPARLLDLGAGTGTGAIGLAQRFPQAEVVALDVDPESLERLSAKVHEHDRFHTVVANLDNGWPELGELDLIWASMSLHHLADPTRTLREAHAATRPGGLIAVAEFARQLRYLPDGFGAGAAGFEDRVLDALSELRAEDMPALGSQWQPRLVDAGWTIVDERDFSIDLNPPRHPKARHYAHAWFSRLSDGLADHLQPEDRATLAALANGSTPVDLYIRGTRTVILARRDL